MQAAHEGEAMANNGDLQDQPRIQMEANTALRAASGKPIRVPSSRYHAFRLLCVNFNNGVESAHFATAVQGIQKIGMARVARGR